MSLLDAVLSTGIVPPDTASRSTKKRYSEELSRNLAYEIAGGLRRVGFGSVKPMPGGPGEKEFQGGLGPKKVDVSYSDDQHGLLLAISIKGINFSPFGKNLKNRFADLCTEAITLHMRFPYSIVGAIFIFPVGAEQDVTKLRKVSTFRRAMKLFATISGRQEHTGVGEKFENITLILYEPLSNDGGEPWVKCFDTRTEEQLTEEEYFLSLRGIFNSRNPHAMVGGDN